MADLIDAEESAHSAALMHFERVQGNGGKRYGVMGVKLGKSYRRISHKHLKVVEDDDARKCAPQLFPTWWWLLNRDAGKWFQLRKL